MKHIKLFENFSKESFDKLEWKGRVLEASNVIDILYDLKEVSLEYLDVRHTHLNDDDEEELVDKKIVFIIDLHDKEVEYLGNLFGGEYSFENIDIEENLYWSNDITAPIEEIEVQCPKCSTIYKDWIRGSINLSLGEEWTDEEIDEATSVTCPNCKYKQYGDSIIVSND